MVCDKKYITRLDTVDSTNRYLRRGHRMVPRRRGQSAQRSYLLRRIAFGRSP